MHDTALINWPWRLLVLARAARVWIGGVPEDQVNEGLAFYEHLRGRWVPGLRIELPQEQRVESVRAVPRLVSRVSPVNNAMRVAATNDALLSRACSFARR